MEIITRPNTVEPGIHFLHRLGMSEAEYGQIDAYSKSIISYQDGFDWYKNTYIYISLWYINMRMRKTY